jgi:hypothetical protein
MCVVLMNLHCPVRLMAKTAVCGVLPDSSRWMQPLKCNLSDYGDIVYAEIPNSLMFHSYYDDDFSGAEIAVG